MAASVVRRMDPCQHTMALVLAQVSLDRNGTTWTCELWSPVFCLSLLKVGFK
jgi:hypothetical protein